MLEVAAFQFCDPVVFLILMEAGDVFFHKYVVRFSLWLYVKPTSSAFRLMSSGTHSSFYLAHRGKKFGSGIGFLLLGLFIFLKELQQPSCETFLLSYFAFPNY